MTPCQVWSVRERCFGCAFAILGVLPFRYILFFADARRC